MKNLILSYLNDEEGQTSTEYILLVAVVAMIVIKFKDKLQTSLDSVTGKVFKKTESFIEDDLN